MSASIGPNSPAEATAARVRLAPKFATYVAIVLATALTVRLMLFPGFAGTDDVVYAARGLEIASGIWRSTNDIGQLRHGINLPIALSSLLFGKGDLALALWSLAASIGEIAIVMLLARSLWNDQVALIAGILMAVTPIHVVLGGRTLADAPLAAFITATFVSFYFAEKSHRRSLYALAGALSGACWWIKPSVAVPLYFGFALILLVPPRRFLTRLAVFAPACAAVIIIELIMLRLMTGDALSTIKALTPYVSKHQAYQGDPLWGSSSPWFYFHRMFLDGRDMWLVPHVALVGVVLICMNRVLSRRLPDGEGERYILFWAICLIGIFSFFPISLDPVKFIPKQENYASIFVAPIVVLAAYAAWRSPIALRIAMLVVICAGGICLAAIEQQGLQNKADRLSKAIELANGSSNRAVYASAQTVNLAKLRALQSNTVHASTLRPLSAFSADVDATLNLSVGERWPVLLVVETSMGEAANQSILAEVKRLRSCATRASTIEGSGRGVGAAILEAADQSRKALPTSVSRHLRFVGDARDPQPATVYSVSRPCAEWAARGGAS